jgi:phage tail sheath protein FI
MPVTTSWPGVYIQELPSLVHSIQPAPTSIAVFIGYTHPFRTKEYLTAVPLFSFADYQANFGGFFSWPCQPDFVGQAVYQFFINGGPMCYVVGLQAEKYYSGWSTEDYSGGTPQGQVGQANVAVPESTSATSASITFTALQPVGFPATASGTGTLGIAMQVVISNVHETSAPNDTADIVVSYGATVETYRKVQIGNLQTTSDLNTSTPLQSNALPPIMNDSNLVEVTLSDPAPTAYPNPPQSPYSLVYTSLSSGQVAPQAGYTVINPAEFGPVFDNYQSLDKVPIFNLLAIPGISNNNVASEAVAFCERKRAFYIADTPSSSAKVGTGYPWSVNDVVTDLSGGTNPSPVPASINAAVYYPWLQTTDPLTGQPMLSPPSGFVAGICGQTDRSSGVWQSPAGIQTALLGTTGVDNPHGLMTDPQQGFMNQNAIDALRQFPSVGTVVFGARTTAGSDANTAQQQWKYVAVRRTALFIEQSLYANLTWAVFQPNAQPLWTALTQEVNAFMLTLFRQHAFAGDTPSQAFLVQCDSTTTTATDIENGIVNILVGFAPLVPAEFVIIQIAQLAGQAQS